MAGRATAALLLAIVGTQHLALATATATENPPPPAMPLIRVRGSPDDVMMPAIGLGTCCGTYNATEWLRLGGRNLDTSMDYGSQPNLGNVVRASGIPRAEIVITSKLNPATYGPDMADAMQQNVLGPLQMDYVDLLLLHHAGVKPTSTKNPPCFDASLPSSEGTWSKCRVQAWGALLKLQKAGKAKAVGVSNFIQRDLEQLYNATGVWPAVNQIETHAYYHTDDLMQFCESKGIVVTAYAPQGNFPYRSNLLADPAFTKVQASLAARGLHRTIGQISLQFDLQVVNASPDTTRTAVPRSQNTTHMGENLSLFNDPWTLNAAEMGMLSNLPQSKIYSTQCQPWC